MRGSHFSLVFVVSNIHHSKYRWVQEDIIFKMSSKRASDRISGSNFDRSKLFSVPVMQNIGALPENWRILWSSRVAGVPDVWSVLQDSWILLSLDVALVYASEINSLPQAYYIHYAHDWLRQAVVWMLWHISTHFKFFSSCFLEWFTIHWRSPNFAMPGRNIVSFFTIS